VRTNKGIISLLSLLSLSNSISGDTYDIRWAIVTRHYKIKVIESSSAFRSRIGQIDILTSLTADAPAARLR